MKQVEDDNVIHSILIFGQSNMGGRGFPCEVEPIVNDRILVLRNGRWRPMYVPVNPDRVTSGTNLAESFCDRYTQDHDAEVGIIPCADGGTSLMQWMPGSLLFDHACYMTMLAQRTSTVTAVLWHQGESDCKEERYLSYEDRLIEIFDAFRERLSLHDVPFIVGGLGEYLKDYKSETIAKNYVFVNQALQNMAKRRAYTGFVSAEGLGANPDNLHFSAAALREFGDRYYDEFLKLENKNIVFFEKPDPDSAFSSGLELL